MNCLNESKDDLNYNNFGETFSETMAMIFFLVNVRLKDAANSKASSASASSATEVTQASSTKPKPKVRL